MARRVSLPTADDLFRTTAPGETGPGEGPASRTAQGPVRAVPDAVPEREAPEEPPKKRASGRIKHDEKMTVYVTSAELLDLERTRLELRGEHGLAVDRGRLVREAIDLVLADFHERGAESMLVRGLLSE